MPSTPSATKAREIEKNERYETLLRLVEKNGSVVRKDVEACLQVSQATAILILRDMVEKGLLIKIGSGKQQKYTTGA